MTTAIRITAGEVQVDAELNNSLTAQAIMEALPIKAVGERWGEEIYCTIPVEADLQPGAREVVQMGELGYWPVGKAFCLFFGDTPASRNGEIRAASAVNIIGTMVSDIRGLSDVPSGAPVVIERR